MIRCDLTTGVAVFLSLIMAVFGVWTFYFIRRKHANDTNQGRITQCPYCGNMMSDYSHKDIVMCSVCHSYLEVRDENYGKKK